MKLALCFHLSVNEASAREPSKNVLFKVSKDIAKLADT